VIKARPLAAEMPAARSPTPTHALGDPVKVFLHRSAGRPQLASWEESQEESSVSPSSRRGALGWTFRKFDELKEKWAHSHGRLSESTRRLWDWLNRETPVDEPFLARLRKVHRVEVHHPATITPDEARALWGCYLSAKQRRHFPRFAVNALISPLTVVLAPLPGPNLIGYWFAYRSLHHLLILYGLRRARSRRVTVTFHPTPDDDEEAGRPMISSRSTTDDGTAVTTFASSMDRGANDC